MEGPTKNQTSSSIAIHVCLKNEFTEDAKYHNLMTWLKLSPKIHLKRLTQDSN